MGSSLFAAGSSVAPADKYIACVKVVLSYPIRWLASQRAMRRSAAELRAMDDRRLADIGLTRDMVEYLTRYGTLPRGWCSHL